MTERPTLKKPAWSSLKRYSRVKWRDGSIRLCFVGLRVMWKGRVTGQGEPVLLCVIRFGLTCDYSKDPPFANTADGGAPARGWSCRLRFMISIETYGYGYP